MNLSKHSFVQLAVLGAMLAPGLLASKVSAGALAGGYIIPSVTLSDCQDTVVPISTGNAGGAISFDFDVTFDASLLSVPGVALTSFTSDCAFAFNTTTPGVVRMSVACPTPRVGPGAIVDMTFTPISFGVSALNFSLCQFDETTCTSTQDGQVDSNVCDPTCTCQGDADKNGFINFADFGSVQANFGSAPDPNTGVGDADCNNFVNFSDFGAVQSNFGTPCP